MERDIEQKRIFLQKEIVDKNYDKTEFINFCLSKKEDGDDLVNWSLEELTTIVSEFQKDSKNRLPDSTQEVNKDKLINKEDITELNNKILEINELKNLLNEKEKRISEINNKNRKLTEELIKIQNLLKNKEIIYIEQKKYNQILFNELSKAKYLIKVKDKIIEKEINKNQKLNKELKDLQNIIKAKEEESNNKMTNLQKVIVDDSNNEKVLKLIVELDHKEKQIKKLNEMKSRFPFELLENEKLMTLIIISGEQNVHYSIICKNTQKFTEIEHQLYQKYPEYLESENYFLVNGKKINKYRSLEENGIKNSDIVSLFKFDDPQ